MGSASPTNMLGLMNQLQGLESSFISVLMEAALKLGAITDTSVFLLIETSEGRRISGKRHLCESYMRGALTPTPTPTDVLYEVDPSVVALRQLTTPQQTPQSEVGGSRSSFGNPDSFQSSSTRCHPFHASLVPINTNYSDTNLSSRKRKSSDASTILSAKYSRDNHHRPSTQLLSQERQLEFDQQPVNDVKVEPNSEFKVENFPGEFASTQISSYLTSGVSKDGNDDDDGDVAIIEDASATNTVSTMITTTMSNVENCDGIPSMSSTGDEICSDLTNMYVSNVPFPLPEDFVKKMVALQSMKTPSVFEKLSIEHRLFTSCVYQLGSVLAKQAVADPAVYKHPTQFEDFFNRHVTLWLSSFPYLAKCESEGMRVDTGKGGMTIGAFVRHRARNAFRKGCVSRLNKAVLIAQE